MYLVISILMTIYNMEATKATEVMLEIHNNGIGLAGIYSLELAELKAEQTTSIARGLKYPLTVSIEPA
jgi:ATP-dependent Clp protease adaptor protein ClpS